MRAEPRRGRRAGLGLLRAGSVGLGIMVLAGLLAPWAAPYDPLEQPDPGGGRHRPPLTSLAAVELENGRWELAERVERVGEGLRVERLGRTEVKPAAAVLNLTADGVADRRVYLLGSDRFSRDVLSRIMHGARISLAIGFLSMALSLAIGGTVGALAALGPRLLDGFLMRVVDGLIVLPWLLLLIVLSTLFSPDQWTLVLLLGSLTWMGTARLMRAELLSLRERDFVVAARGLGASPWRVFWRHLLPNAMTPVLIQAMLLVGRMILFESTLSFLGFGVQPPDPTWGNMIAEARHDMSTAWWEGVFPGLALVGTVISLHLMTDGLRDLLDPRAVRPRG